MCESPWCLAQEIAWGLVTASFVIILGGLSSPLIPSVLILKFNIQRLILFFLIPDSRRMPHCSPERPNTGSPAHLTAQYLLFSAMGEIMLQGHPVLVPVLCVQCQPLHCFELG